MQGLQGTDKAEGVNGAQPRPASRALEQSTLYGVYRDPKSSAERGWRATIIVRPSRFA